LAVSWNFKTEEPGWHSAWNILRYNDIRKTQRNANSEKAKYGPSHLHAPRQSEFKEVTEIKTFSTSSSLPWAMQTAINWKEEAVNVISSARNTVARA
jgi:hypothetical protein